MIKFSRIISPWFSNVGHTLTGENKLDSGENENKYVTIFDLYLLSFRIMVFPEKKEKKKRFSSVTINDDDDDELEKFPVGREIRMMRLWQQKTYKFNRWRRSFPKKNFPLLKSSPSTSSSPSFESIKNKLTRFGIMINGCCYAPRKKCTNGSNNTIYAILTSQTNNVAIFNSHIFYQTFSEL